MRQFSTGGQKFWVMAGDDGVSYEPWGSIPAGFEQDGLRVHMIAWERRGVITFTMIGPVVDIVSLRRID